MVESFFLAGLRTRIVFNSLYIVILIFSSDLKSSMSDQPVRIGAFADNRKFSIPEPEPIDIPFRNLLSTPQQSPPSLPSLLGTPPPSAAAFTALKNADNNQKSADSGSVKSADNASVKNADCENGNVLTRCDSVGSHGDEPFILVDLVFDFQLTTLTLTGISFNWNDKGKSCVSEGKDESVIY